MIKIGIGGVMQYGEFTEILSEVDPAAFIMFDDGAYVVGAHTEDGRVRLFRDDDMGFDLGCPLIHNRADAAELAEEPEWAGNLLDRLRGQCGWTWEGAAVIVSLPGQMYFRHVEFDGVAGDGTVVLRVGDMIW